MLLEGCRQSKHGCCADGITSAGSDFEGCPLDGAEQDCRETEFGCCIDGLTPASGPFGYVPDLFMCIELSYGFRN